MWSASYFHPLVTLINVIPEHAVCVKYAWINFSLKFWFWSLCFLQRTQISIINITLTFHQNRFQFYITLTLAFKSHTGSNCLFTLLLLMAFGAFCHLPAYPFLSLHFHLFCFPFIFSVYFSLPLIYMSTHLVFFLNFLFVPCIFIQSSQYVVLPTLTHQVPS